MAASRGIVAAGHELTAAAAAALLREGGNAFDAALAALAAACVVEPVLASLGGGGFLLARPAAARERLYDFFVQTPSRPRAPAQLDFRPILADFGTAQQEFHIGRGTVAAPGVVRGIFAVHRDLATRPIAEILAPAIHYAREGVRVNEFQAYIFRVVEAIYTATPAVSAIYGSRRRPGHPTLEGELLLQPELAAALEALAVEGEELFYRGEIARAVAEDMREGGHLTKEDLAAYRVEMRAPLTFGYRGARLLTNPPPSSGGVLVAFALELLEGTDLAAHGFGSPEHLELLARVMDLTSQARLEAHLDETAPHPEFDRLLDPEFVAVWRDRIAGRARARRGTTHVSAIDAEGNVASLSVSNGQGSAYVVPGTGIVLNNMMGEADLNPRGFHRWPPGQRMTSMMAPTVALSGEGRLLATGSGGSNRLRTAILQVLLNLLEFRMDVEAAVHAPRIHYEGGLLSLEDGFALERIAPVLGAFPTHQVWEGRNLFFGGTHTVSSGPDGLRGVGDPRRGGACVIVKEE